MLALRHNRDEIDRDFLGGSKFSHPERFSAGLWLCIHYTDFALKYLLTWKFVYHAIEKSGYANFFIFKFPGTPSILLEVKFSWLSFQGVCVYWIGVHISSSKSVFCRLFNKFTSVFYVSVLLLIINFVITLSK